MSNAERILSFLRTKKGKQYCDDCLSACLKIYPRQQINQICRNLFDRGCISREKGSCSNCSKYKIVNFSGKSSDALVKSMPTQDAFLTNSDQGRRLDYGAFEDRVSKFQRVNSEKDSINKIYRLVQASSIDLIQYLRIKAQLLSVRVIHGQNLEIFLQQRFPQQQKLYFTSQELLLVEKFWSFRTILIKEEKVSQRYLLGDTMG